MVSFSSFSVVINLVLVVVISIYWLSFHYFPTLEEEPVIIELMEIPAPEQPASKAPLQEAEVAELSPIPEVEDKKAELPPEVESEDRLRDAAKKKKR